MGNGSSYITLAEAAPGLGQEVVQLIDQKEPVSDVNVHQSLVIAGTTAAAVLVKKRHELYQKFFLDLPLYILTEHRSAVVGIFGLPASFLWDHIMMARSKYIQTFYSAPHLHDQRVLKIQEQVKNRPDPNAPICTSRPGWQSISPSYRNYKKKWNAIDMPLHDILSVDEEGMMVHVEPFVSVGQLTHALNPKGFTLPVVPEMDDLTVGGLIMGTGIESSSHKYGLFHEIILELELLLGDGTVVVATAGNEYSDLFHAAPWSYGTLGLLLSAKLTIIPCKNYVKLTYTPHHSKDGYVEHMRQLSGEYLYDNTKKLTGVTVTTNNGSTANGMERSTPMFAEALAYSLDTAVVMSGEFIDVKDVPRGRANRIGLWHKPWFYKHVEQILWTKPKANRIWSWIFGSTQENKEPSYEPVVEYIPLRDYYHRHTQSLFWEMEMLLPIGNNFLFRWLFGWLMPPKVSFIKLFQTEMMRDLMERTHIAQDFLVPTRNWSSFMEVCDKEFDRIYPVWLCFHDHAPMPGSLLKDPAKPDPTRNNHEMYIDVGIYGLPRCVWEKREDEFDAKKSMRNVLKACIARDGFQMLYADVFFTREEFEQMFDHKEYRKLRRKYHADTGVFKEVYDKMSVVL